MSFRSLKKDKKEDIPMKPDVEAMEVNLFDT